MKMDGSVLEERSSVSLLCISINLPYAHIWNTVVTSGLVTLVATWNCQTSYKNEYAGLLVLHLLLLLNPWLIVEMWPAEVFSIGITLVHVLQNWLDWFLFLFLQGGLLVFLIDCIVFFITIPRCDKDVYVNSLFSRTASLWNSMPIEWL